MADTALKALIRATETGKHDPNAQYNTIIGHNEKHLAKPVTQMTVDEIIAASDSWRKRFGTTSGAAGAYQIIKPTMASLKKTMGLSGSEQFTPALQDRMADQLLEQRGLSRFMRGEIGATAFGNSLALEWASFPLLAAASRGKIKLKRGQSYYDKFAGNSALISAETVEAVLRDMRKPEKPDIPIGFPAPAPAPVPPAEHVEGGGKTPGWVVAVVILALAAAVAAYYFFTGR